MISLTPWATLTQDNSLWCEDGTHRELETKDVKITRGKYMGTLLSDFTDRGYLEWMQKTMVDDDFIQLAVTKRLNEL